MKRFLYGSFVTGRGAWGLLFLRCFFGLGLMIHGSGKMEHPFSWMGENAPTPAFLQFLAAISEFFGGMALIVGLLTPVAALGIICTMSVAAFVAMADAPFIAKGQGSSKELALTYLFSALTVFLTGPGAISLDALLFGRKADAADKSISAVPATSH